MRLSWSVAVAAADQNMGTPSRAGWLPRMLLQQRLPLVLLLLLTLAGRLLAINAPAPDPLCAYFAASSQLPDRQLLDRLQNQSHLQFMYDGYCKPLGSLLELHVIRKEQHVFLYQQPRTIRSRPKLAQLNGQRRYVLSFSLHLQLLPFLPLSCVPLVEVVLQSGHSLEAQLFLDDQSWRRSDNAARRGSLSSHLSTLNLTAYQTRQTYLQLPRSPDELDRLAQMRPRLQFRYAFIGLGTLDANRSLSHFADLSRQPLQLGFYVIACGRIDQQRITYANCTALLRNEKLICRCPVAAQTNYYLMPGYLSAVMLLFWAYIGLVLRQAHGRRAEQKQIGSEQVFWVLCSPKSVQYRYELCFRIGCASWNFDFKTTSIDFELLAPEGRLMTQGRINTNLLLEERVNEITFLMNRLTPLTQSSLEMISFKHNGQVNSKIYFYGIYITEYENRTRHYFPVNSYIRSFWLKATLLPSTEPIDTQLRKIDASGEKSPSGSLSSLSTSTSNYNVRTVRAPEKLRSTLFELKSTELSFIQFLATAVIHALPRRLFHDERDDDEAVETASIGLLDLVWWLLFTVACVALLVLAVSLFFRLVVKYFTLKHYFLHRRNLLRFASPLAKLALFAVSSLVHGQLILQTAQRPSERALTWLLFSANCVLIVFGFWTLLRSLQLLNRLVYRRTAGGALMTSRIDTSMSKAPEDEPSTPTGELKTTSM